MAHSGAACMPRAAPVLREALMAVEPVDLCPSDGSASAKETSKRREIQRKRPVVIRRANSTQHLSGRFMSGEYCKVSGEM